MSLDSFQQNTIFNSYSILFHPIPLPIPRRPITPQTASRSSCFLFDVPFDLLFDRAFGKIEAKARRAVFTLSESGKNSIKSGSIITRLVPSAYFFAYLLGRALEKSYSARISHSSILSIFSFFILLSFFICCKSGTDYANDVFSFSKDSY